MSQQADGLRTLRLMFVAILIPLLLFVFTTHTIVSDGVAGEAPAWVGPGLALWGLAAVAAVLWFRSRRLDTSDAPSLVASYRSAFLICLGLAESPALGGMAVALLIDELWPYLEGLAFALVGLALIAPTGRNLERQQQQITAQGSALSLVEALRTARPGPRRR
jgi:hypothetical protein